MDGVSTTGRSFLRGFRFAKQEHQLFDRGVPGRGERRDTLAFAQRLSHNSARNPHLRRWLGIAPKIASQAQCELAKPIEHGRLFPTREVTTLHANSEEVKTGRRSPFGSVLYEFDELATAVHLSYTYQRRSRLSS